jgi:tetratricopeptide (TPR) repeat protein
MKMMALLFILSLPAAAPAPRDDDVDKLRKEVAELRAALEEEKVLRRELVRQLKQLQERVARLREKLGEEEAPSPPPPPPPPPEGPPEEPTVAEIRVAEGYYDEARRMVELERYDEAVKAFDKALEILPEDRNLLYQRGSALMELGRKDEGLRDLSRVEATYEEALGENPDHPGILYSLGILRNRMEKYDEAIRDFDRVIDLGERHWEVYFGRAFSYFYKEEYEQAIEDFLESTEVHPAHPENSTSFYNIACAYALMGDKDRALRYLKRSVEKGFDDFEHMQEDEDLKILRGDPRFEDMLHHGREI